nr:MAG TPA: hypothetical protein [Caudoviricetes sp.]
MSQGNDASSKEQLNSFYVKIKEKNGHDDSDAAPLTCIDEEAAYNASSGAQSYNDIKKREQTAKAYRHELINKVIESLEEPLKKEQESKNNFRFWILVSFSIFFVGITIATFIFLSKFSEKGFTEYSAQVSTVLISGLFVNIVGLAIIIFKYLFDDKGSLLKDMIQLLENTLKNDDESYSEH